MLLLSFCIQELFFVSAFSVEAVLLSSIFKKSLITGWGERADIWLEEDGGELTAHTFNYCTLTSKKGDTVAFFDYLPAIKSDHRDMYGNQRKIDILCDIAKGLLDNPNEYDLEIVAELIREGYVVKESGRFAVTMPVYSQLQYKLLPMSRTRQTFFRCLP